MTDVEELLRETLTDSRYRLDPVPGIYDGVKARELGLRRRRITFASAAAAVVAVAVAGSFIGVQQAGRHSVTTVPTPTVTNTIGPTPTLPPQGTTGTPIDLGSGFGTVDAVVTTGEALYVMTSLGDTTTVLLFSPTGGQFQMKMTGPRGTPTGLAVGDGKVWAWSAETRNLKVYDAHNLTPLGDFTTNYQILNAVALDGVLFVSTSTGLYYSAEDATLSAPATKVPGIDMAYGLAGDPARHRVVVGVFKSNGSGAQIVAVDTRTKKVTAGAQTSLGKESIAVVGDDIWVGGYASGDTKRLIHLDARTLQVVGSSAISAMLGPGAVVWPGQHVVWVSAGGDGSVSCINPVSGAVHAEWNAARGPVTSVGGSAYALNPNVVPLLLTGGCTG